MQGDSIGSLWLKEDFFDSSSLQPLQYTCKCDKTSGVTYACDKVYYLLQLLYNKKFEYEKMTKLYRDISNCGIQCSELRDFD